MNEHPSSEQVLNWKREEAIAVPSPDRERRMAIRYSDWLRIKRRFSVLGPVPNLSVVYSILFGVAASSGPSIIPIAASQGLPSWVTPLYISVFAFSLLCGCVFVWVHKKFRSIRKRELQDIEADMNDIESMFETRREDR